MPVVNNIAPRKRYQWKVLPQGMLNSPTLCQYYVASVVEPVRRQFPKCYIVHYMDDILCAAPSQEQLTEVFQCLQTCLKGAGLVIAPEKIQMKSPYQYLGTVVERTTVHPQKVELRRDQISTLNDLQKLLGDINWLRPYLGIPTYELSNLFSLLRGDSKLNSPRSLTAEAEEELKKIESKIQNSQLSRVNLKQPIQLVIIPSPHSPTGILMQLENILEWLFLPNNVTKSLSPYLDLMAQLILKGRTRCVQMSGKDLNHVIVSLTIKEIQNCFQNHIGWQIAFADYVGSIDNHYPKNPVLQFIKRTQWILPKKVKESPIIDAPVIFTDGTSKGKAGYVANQSKII